jgi:hypothetical protein
LDGDDKVLRCVELDGLDDSVLRGAGGDDEVIAGGADGLVMAGVDEEVRGVFAELYEVSAGWVRRAKGELRMGGGVVPLWMCVAKMGDEGREPGSWGDFEGVGFEDGTFGGVVYGGSDLGGDVLDEGASAPDVEGLQALTDGEDRLVEVEGVLQEELVNGGAWCVGRRALGDAGLTVFLRVDVGGAAGKKDSLDGGEDFGDALRRLVEGNGDGCSSGRVERVEVLGKSALVVGGGIRYGR